MMRKTIPIWIFPAALIAIRCGVNNPSTGGNDPSNSNQITHVYVGGCDINATPFGAGAGTSSSPYQICSVAHLNSLSNPLYSSASVIMVADVDATNQILLAAAPFSGTFDGQGYAIKNWTGATNLFQSLTGTIKNLNLTNLNLVGSFRLGLVQTVQSTGVVSNVSVQGTLYGPYMAGTIAGVNKGKILNCSVNVDISGNDTIGGLVGVNVGTIQGSSCSGKVHINNLNSEIVAADYGKNFGGIAAYNDSGTISQSSSSCQVTGITGIGGLAGEVLSGVMDHDSSSGLIIGMFDSTYLDNGGHNSSGYYVGGLIGLTDAGSISNSYSQATVQGVANVGGLIGLNAATITTSYSMGSVSGTSTGLGGLIGLAPGGSVTTSYWDNQASGQATSAGGTGAATAAMQTQATYVGFDFTGTWFPPSAGVYPSLR